MRGPTPEQSGRGGGAERRERQPFGGEVDAVGAGGESEVEPAVGEEKAGTREGLAG